MAKPVDYTMKEFAPGQPVCYLGQPDGQYRWQAAVVSSTAKTVVIRYQYPGFGERVSRVTASSLRVIPEAFPTNQFFPED